MASRTPWQINAPQHSMRCWDIPFPCVFGSEAMASQAPKPLPKSRTVLRTLYDRCEGCVQLAERYLYRGRRWLQLIEKCRDGKITFEELRQGSQQLLEHGEADQNNFLPDPFELMSHCDPDAVQLMHELGKAGRACATGEAMQGVKDDATAAKFWDTVLNWGRAHSLHLALLRDLSGRIATALDMPSGADKSADIAKIMEKLAPRNDEVSQLHRKLLLEEGSGKSQNAIALEFTDGDKERATSLLRQVRRYRENLKAALDDLDS